MSSEPPPPEYRIGPMVFVPEFNARAGGDPWAHRKGEPRPLALFWLLYLMTSAAVTIFAAYNSMHYPSQWQFIYACRALFVLLALGGCVLWPMLRLSQEFPERPHRATLADLGVLVLPAWVAMLPSPLLTRWPFEIAIALASSITAWMMLAASIVLLAYRWPGHVARASWMAGIIVLSLAGPLAVVLFHAPQTMLWFSPFTAVFEITHSEPALTPSMVSREWLLALSPAAPALIVGFISLTLPRAAPPRPIPTQPLH